MVVHLNIFAAAHLVPEYRWTDLEVDDFIINDVYGAWRILSLIFRSGGTTGRGHFWAYRRIPKTSLFVRVEDGNVLSEPCAIKKYSDVGDGKLYLIFAELKSEYF
jgi:hypothetical protein